MKLTYYFVNVFLTLTWLGQRSSAAEVNKDESKDDPLFRPFEKCLQKGGVKNSSIVHRSESSTYKDLNYQWQANGENLRPLAFVIVENEENVVAAIHCAKEYKIRLMPKSGGHSMEKFSFGDKNSVIVDVRKLTKVEVDKTKMTAMVGAGIQIGPLAWKLWELGKVFTPLGICPTIGISGMATGGGLGYFVRKFGLTLDNILEIKIVTADEEIRTVNADKDADLFWALRGGVASSFGIVTEFVFKVFPAPEKMYLGTLTYTMSQFPQVFKAYQQATHTAPKDVTLHMDVYGLMTAVFIDWTGRSDNYEAIAKEFPPNGSEYKAEITYEEFMLHNARNLSGELLSPGFELTKAADLAKLEHRSPDRIYQARKSFYVTKEIGDDEIETLGKLTQEMPNGVVTFYEAYGGFTNEVPKNETAFVHRNGTLYNAVVNYRSQDFGNVAAHAEATKFVKRYFNVGKELFDHKESLQNYVDLELENPLDRYFGSNLPRLVEVKKKYDPENFFYTPQSIPTRLN